MASGLRLLLLGYGHRGRGWLRACSDRGSHRIVGVVDPSPEAREAVAAKRIPAWEHLEEALGVTDAEAAIIASPNHAHVPQGIRCLRSGLGILVEKPMAPTLVDAMPLVEEARRTALPAIVGQHKRFLRREHVTRRILDSGVLGRSSKSTVELHYPPPRTGDPWLVADALVTDGVHLLDTLRVRHGVDVEIRAASVLEPGRTFAQAFLVTLDWTDGTSAACTFRRTDRTEHYHEMIEGDRAYLFVVRERVYLVRRNRPRRIWLPRRTHPEHTLLDRLLAWHRGRPHPELGLEDNLWTIAMMDATNGAFETGHPSTPAAVADHVGVALPPLHTS